LYWTYAIVADVPLFALSVMINEEISPSSYVPNIPLFGPTSVNVTGYVVTPNNPPDVSTLSILCPEPDAVIALSPLS